MPLTGPAWAITPYTQAWLRGRSSILGQSEASDHSELCGKTWNEVLKPFDLCGLRQTGPATIGRWSPEAHLFFGVSDAQIPPAHRAGVDDTKAEPRTVMAIALIVTAGASLCVYWCLRKLGVELMTAAFLAFLAFCAALFVWLLERLSEKRD